MLLIEQIKIRVSSFFIIIFLVLSPLSFGEGQGVRLEETKATKTAIGGLRDTPASFQTHTINYHHGDIFYLSTDGFADQFSTHDKKMMTKRFKETILSVQNKTMYEQGNHLKEYFINWKGNMEQTDDVLVIGFKL